MTEIGMSSSVFKAKDMNGDDFWVDWDGAEGIGFWVGDPEDLSQCLSIGTSLDLVLWFQENWEVKK
jgi:hypothetical protein